jgi:hypothetical protein
VIACVCGVFAGRKIVKILLAALAGADNFLTAFRVAEEATGSKKPVDNRRESDNFAPSKLESEMPS